MNKFLWLLLAVLNIQLAYGQNTFKAIVKDKSSSELLFGVTAVVKGTTLAGVSDMNGAVTIENVPNGRQAIVFTYVGLEKLQMEFVFPLASGAPVEVFM